MEAEVASEALTPSQTGSPGCCSVRSGWVVRCVCVNDSMLEI